MIPNTDVTIYNAYADPTTRTKKWIRNVVKRIVWENKRAVNGLRSGALASNVAQLLIPFSSGDDYVEPKAWIALESKAGKWTLSDGDVIVKGLASQEITDIYTIRMLTDDYEDVVTISSVDPMDQGSMNMRHWDVGAK